MDQPHHLIGLFKKAKPWQTPSEGPWRDAHLSVVDIETTGLGRRDEIVSVGVVHVSEGRITPETFYEVVRPARAISPESMCVHGLTKDELAGAPEFAQIVPRLRDAISGSVVVAHAAWVERAFLNRALRPFGEQIPAQLVDTAALARSVGLAPPGRREPSLEALSRRLELPVHTPHHALGDAQTTAQVLLALVARLERERGTVTLADLLSLSAEYGN